MLKEGINDYIKNQDYHDDREWISSSGLKMLYENPKLFHKRYIENSEDSPSSAAMDLGSYYHGRILEPDLVDEEFVIFTGASRRGKAWEEFRDNAGDKIIITKSQKSLVDNMVDGFNQSKVTLDKEVPLRRFFEDGKAEESMCTYINGVPVKIRCDYRKVGDNYASINDIKTTMAKARNPKEAKEIIDKYQYDISAALYVDVAEKVTGQKHDFYIVFSDKNYFDSYIYKVSEKTLQEGRQKYLAAIDYYKQAKESGIWYTNEIQEV